jgi:hypothetical protein
MLVCAIAQIHQRWEHIQDVILQPHSPGSHQTWDAPTFDPHHAGWELLARSPVYPQYDSWLSEELQTAVKRWRTDLGLCDRLPASAF